ncbi:hypothetical protein DJ021_12755 [Phenylobacterium hankyongense]|uniref:Uncharacterized protein n=1 Tax=Phenylobacterium hankyongense TaxID=1813876 RepID=A0A328B442_9CAUL|nr:hypothetical protein [Phenylobacterium hankyongense]RAK60614.1 hypothetical protein DJ021_12755 [Phenylobacterium hankyongense]
MRLNPLYSGAGLALVAGLLMGGAMKPNLGGDDRPAGPQMFAGWSGARSTGPFDDGASITAYSGQVPDYVTGTDWKKALAWPGEQVAYLEPQPRLTGEAQADVPTDYAQAAYVEPPPAQATYPSMSGGMDYRDRAAAAEPAAPPPRTFDEDAPPEATGDATTPAQG